LYEIQGDAQEERRKNSDRASGKANQAQIVEQVDEDLCDVLAAQSEKGKYSDVWSLDSGCTYHMCPKRE